MLDVDKVVTDAYFPRSQRIAALKGVNPWVRYNVFIRQAGRLCGMPFVERLVRRVNQSIAEPRERIRLRALAERRRYNSCEPVAWLEGRFQDLVSLETALAGYLSLSGPATHMNEIVAAADGVPVIDMSPRHYFPDMNFSAALTYAAYAGGARGTSSPEGWLFVLSLLEDAREGSIIPRSLLEDRRATRVHRRGDAYYQWMAAAYKLCKDLGEQHDFQLFGTIPHALNAVMGGSNATAQAFLQVLPTIPLTVLTDYEGKELDVIRDAVTYSPERVFGVRLDTHGGRVHQAGSADEEAFLQKESFFRPFLKDPGWSALMTWLRKDGRYVYGPGVTLEAYFNARMLLNDLGAKYTKIVLSSGFTAEKTKVFRRWIDPNRTAIGTGSWVGPMKHHPTMDIVEINEGARDGTWRPALKVGREYQPSDRLKEIQVG